MNVKRLRPPIFIGGIPKSGTSLMRTLVGNHPNIFGGDGFETHWFSDDFLDHWKNPNSKRQKWFRKWYNISVDETRLIKHNSKSGIEYFKKMMDFCAIRDDKIRWIEKTTGNLDNYEKIDENWDKFIFINCIRDFRDIYASWKSKSTGTLMNYNVNEYVNKVKKSYHGIHEMLGKRTSNYIEIKYENLILDTEGTLKNIISFINEKWVEDLHYFQGNPLELKKVKKIIQSKGSKTSESISKPIFTTSIGQWNYILDNEELNIINYELEHLFAIFGYR